MRPDWGFAWYNSGSLHEAPGLLPGGRAQARCNKFNLRKHLEAAT